MDNKNYNIVSPQKKATFEDYGLKVKRLKGDELTKRLAALSTILNALKDNPFIETSIMLSTKSACKIYNKESIKFRTELKNNFIGK